MAYEDLLQDLELIKKKREARASGQQVLNRDGELVRREMLCVFRKLWLGLPLAGQYQGMENKYFTDTIHYIPICRQTASAVAKALYCSKSHIMVDGLCFKAATVEGK
jgi:hypothetical protein